MGTKAAKHINSISKAEFNYQAFRKQINGESFGVSRVVREKIANRFNTVINEEFYSIGEEIKSKKFYEDIRQIANGFNKQPAAAKPKVNGSLLPESALA